MDIFEKCFNYTTVKEAIKEGFYPFFIPLTENEGTEVEYRGHRLIMCGSNNYLGLTTHPKVREAAIQAINRFGTSCTGSRFLNGTLEMHEKLEAELAKWVGKQASLTFSTGMQVNLGTVSALVGRDDIVILDKDDHASIVDGARLGYGKIQRYRHNDMEHLECVMKGLPDEAGKLIVVDGLFSMEGDLAPLDELVVIAKQYGARLMVDDAHGSGVLGRCGRGSVDLLGVSDDVDIKMGTFDKALGSFGAYAGVSDEIRELLVNRCRSFIFSTSLPPAVLAASLAAVKLVQSAEGDALRERLQRNAHLFRKGLIQAGFTIPDGATQIIPLITGQSETTMRFSEALLAEGLFAQGIRPPTVPAGLGRIRFTVMASHDPDDLNRALERIEAVGRRLGVL